MRYTSDLSKEGVIFSDRPDSVPYNYRISFKIAVICLIMSKCCGKRGCSLTKIHILSGAVMDYSLFDKLVAVIFERKEMDLCVRFDPAVNRAIEYARSDEIIYQQANGLYRLSDKGRQLADMICEDESLMQNEKKLLNKISSDLSEEVIQRISEKWRGTDV